MKRKNSFIIINIEEMETINLNENQLITNAITNAIKKINKEQSLLRLILYINYYLLTFCLINLFKIKQISLFLKKFKTDNILLCHNKEIYKPPCINDLILYDNGMILNDLFIPYENIIQFGYTDDTVYLDLFAKINKMEDNFTFSLGHNIVNISIKTKFSLKICKHIKHNLYYHIKYNKIDIDIIKQFYKKNL